MAKAKRAAPPKCCWGAQLQGVDTVVCSRGHVKGSRHFKTKFCANCKAAILLPLQRVRCLTNAQAAIFTNNHSGGLWTLAAPQHGGFRFRVVNNTHGCQPPQLIVFKEPLPDDDAWQNLPARLQSGDGFARLCVSKGTIVPTQHLRALHYKPADERALPPPPQPVVCEVLVPSVVMKLPPPSPAPEPEPEPEPESEPETPSSAGEREEPAFSSYNERRMHRNRQSAAKSRLMKRKYIETLERNVEELSHTVEKLRHENRYLQNLRTVNIDDALHLDWSALDAVEC
jgi:hypothetical protein